MQLSAAHLKSLWSDICIQCLDGERFWDSSRPGSQFVNPTKSSLGNHSHCAWWPRSEPASQNVLLYGSFKNLQDVWAVLQDEMPIKLTGCDVESDHSMNVLAPTSRPSPARIVPFSQLIQKGLNSVQDSGLWDVVVMGAHCLHFRITDNVFFQPPKRTSYDRTELFRCSERITYASLQPLKSNWMYFSFLINLSSPSMKWYS